MEDQNQQQNPAPMSAAKKNIPMGVLSYLGPFVIVSYLVAKDDLFVKFHIKQGLVLLIIELCLWLIAMTFFMLAPVVAFVDIALLVLIVIGILNVIAEKEKELPLIGSFAKHFTF